MKRIKPATKQQATLVRQLREHYPDAEKISLAVRGDGNRLTPEPMEVVYVMSTGGKWGRSSEVRVGNRLQTMLDQRDHDAALWLEKLSVSPDLIPQWPRSHPSIHSALHWPDSTCTN